MERCSEFPNTEGQNLAALFGGRHSANSEKSKPKKPLPLPARRRKRELLEEQRKYGNAE